MAAGREVVRGVERVSLAIGARHAHNSNSSHCDRNSHGVRYLSSFLWSSLCMPRGVASAYLVRSHHVSASRAGGGETDAAGAATTPAAQAAKPPSSSLSPSPLWSAPMRILFCGSDEFSCVSLRALDAVRRGSTARGAASPPSPPPFVESIEVVVRPGKRTGRGLQTVRCVPLQQLAEELGLTVHVRDTFKGWSPPSPVDLIVAVSFGLFVPPRLLRMAKYGGINVHPSMLPDLRGPAPIHHSLLLGRTHTGVSLQTLDEASFDHGVVLKQTAAPGLAIQYRDDNSISTETVASLLEQLASMGATMLVNGLREGLHVPPLEDVAWTPAFPVAYAPKLGPADRQFDWRTWTAAQILRRDSVLGSLWGLAVVGSGGSSSRSPGRKAGGSIRVILADLAAVPAEEVDIESLGPIGTVRWHSKTMELPDSIPEDNHVSTTVLRASSLKSEDRVLVRLPSDAGAWLRVGRAKIEGKDFKPARPVFQALAGM